MKIGGKPSMSYRHLIRTRIKAFSKDGYAQATPIRYGQEKQGRKTKILRKLELAFIAGYEIIFQRWGLILNILKILSASWLETSNSTMTLMYGFCALRPI